MINIHYAPNNKLNVKGRLFFSNIKNKSLSFLFLMILISNTLKKIQWLWFSNKLHLLVFTNGYLSVGIYQQILRH